MGLRCRILAAVLCSACGEVQVTADASGGDGPGCVGCLANGQSCSAGTECTSGECACSNPTCTAKVCSPIACECQFTGTGGGTCDGYVAAGYDDGADSCGPSACDGTGVCGLPLLWYRFDEAAGTGSIANSGTWPGAVASVAGMQGVPGKIDNAIRIAAATEGVALDDPLDDSLDRFTSWTAEGWINMTALPLDGYATLVRKDAAYFCRLVEGAGCVSCYTLQAIVFSPTQQAVNWTMPIAPATNTWHHMACTYAANTLTVYWNGSAQMSIGGGNGALANSASALAIGRMPSGGENLQGAIDDFRMWNTARTDRQICLDACGSYAGSTCTFDGICGN